MPGICSCITARITVPINCRYRYSSITKAIIDLQLEISASAQRCGIVYSGRCLADPQGWHRPEDKMCGASLRSVADLVLQVAGLTVAAELGQRRLVQLKQDLAQHLRRWIEDELAN